MPARLFKPWIYLEHVALVDEISAAPASKSPAGAFGRPQTLEPGVRAMTHRASFNVAGHYSKWVHDLITCMIVTMLYRGN